MAGAIYRAGDVKLGNGGSLGDAVDALFSAVMRDDAEGVHAAIARGADVNATRTNGSTPLHIGASAERVDAVRALLSHGPNLNAKDAYGNAPLHYAVALCEMPELAKLLIAAGADVDVADRDGQRPLGWAFGRRRVEMAQLLMEAGADQRFMDHAWRAEVLEASRRAGRHAASSD